MNQFSNFLDKNFYIKLLCICTAGYAWILWTLYAGSFGVQSIDICFIKNLIGIPCPSCGSTRSAVFLLQGNVTDALYINPLGLILFTAIVVTPLWIVFDFIFRKKTLFVFYFKFEGLFRKRVYISAFIIIIFFNWVWNIIKDV